MRFEAGTYLQCGRFHLDKALLSEEIPDRAEDSATRGEVRAPRREPVGTPPFCPMASPFARHSASPLIAKLLGNRPNGDLSETY
jgi:hypothetical protein